jgi:hypothetical protein
MSERAECVMLNKGPYINDAVVAIDNILQRMARHHYKKRPITKPAFLAARVDRMIPRMSTRRAV